MHADDRRGVNRDGYRGGQSGSNHHGRSYKGDTTLICWNCGGRGRKKIECPSDVIDDDDPNENDDENHGALHADEGSSSGDDHR
jgi:hypothetical protein